MQFPRIWTGFFLVLLGDHFSMFALPILIYHETRSIFAAGMAYAIEWLPRLVLTPFGGILVDKWGARKTIILIDAIKFVVGIVGYVVLDLHLASPYIVGGLIAAVISVGTSQTLVACESLVSKNYTGNDYLKKTTAMTLADQSTMVLGPVLGIALYQIMPVKFLVLMSTVFYLLSALNMLTLRINDFFEIRDRGVIENLATGIKIMRQLPIFIAVAILNSLLNMTSGIVEASAVVMTQSHFGLSMENFGVINLVAGVVGSLSLAATPLLLKKINARGITIVSLILFCTVCVLINLFLSSFPIYVGLYGISIGATIMSALYFKELRNKYVPIQHQGKVIANMSFLSYLSLPLSGVLVGSLRDASQIGIYILILGVVSVIVGAVVVYFGGRMEGVENDIVDVLTGQAQENDMGT